MISVIFPIFNCEDLLTNAINNILNQSFNEFELLCIDNYSNDSSLNILRQFEKQDSRIKVFSCDSNCNLVYYINYCIESSKNKYIYFFDPHFSLKSDAFDFFITISENNKLDYLMFNYDVITQNNLPNLRFDFEDNFKIFERGDHDFYFKLPISSGNVFFSKNFLLNENFHFDENFHEIFYKLRFNSQRSAVINDSFATVEKSTKYYVESIFKETKSIFSIFKWLFQCADVYEYYKTDFLNFVLNNLKELYTKLSNFNPPSNQTLFFHIEKSKFVNYLICIFDKFYYDYGVYDDLVGVDDCLFNFFKEFLVNDGKYRLSIVIPVFNCESYIEDTLNSIINQTLNFNTIEVIVVDDCSEDDSPIIIKGYSEKYDNIKAFFLEKNSQYAGKPRNIALNNVSSNYVCFLDADDYYYSNACETFYFNMLYYEADVVIGNFSMDTTGGNKKKMIDSGLSYFNNLNEFHVLKFDSVKNNPYILSSANVWNKIFRVDIIKDNNILFLEGVPAQDSGFLFHYLLNAKNIIFINDMVVHYHNLRNTAGNKSVTHLRNYLNISGRIEVYYWMYGICLEYNVEEVFVKNILKFKLPYWFNQLLTTEISDENLKKIFIKYQVLFEKCVEYEVVLPKRLITIFNLIALSKFDDIIEEFKKIK